jgi:hypothetical protein
MRRKIETRWRGFRASGRISAAVLERWLRHEWHSLQGHQLELAERLQLARSARDIRELVCAQLDLVPESRRRLRRNAEGRRALLAELGGALRIAVARD